MTREYTESHCWQYDIRLRNREDDVIWSGLADDEIAQLRVRDFEFKRVEDDDGRIGITEFIKRHEWLGTLSQYTTHWYACYYREVMAGAILFGIPNAFSKMLGENTPQLERLISRGACISWSPKNLASAFLTWCISDMVKHTEYRLFTAYSDTEAKEIGTIYQACNFYYLGQNSGCTARYINPFNGKVVSDRFFRARSAYKKYATALGIPWDSNWTDGTGMLWDNVPNNIEAQLRAESKRVQKASLKVATAAKHKYAFVLGNGRLETQRLRKEFLSRNKTYPYPKER